MQEEDSKKSIAWDYLFVCLFVSTVWFAGISALAQPQAGIRQQLANCSWLGTLLGCAPNSAFGATSPGVDGAEVISSGFTAVAWSLLRHQSKPDAGVILL